MAHRLGSGQQSEDVAPVLRHFLAAAEVAQRAFVEPAQQREHGLVVAAGELGDPGDHDRPYADQLDLVGVQRGRLHQLDIAGKGDTGSVRRRSRDDRNLERRTCGTPLLETVPFTRAHRCPPVRHPVSRPSVVATGPTRGPRAAPAKIGGCPMALLFAAWQPLIASSGEGAISSPKALVTVGASVEDAGGRRAGCVTAR